MMSNDLDNTRENFYFVRDSAKPISETTRSLFSRTKAQRKLLEVLDELHSNSSRGTVIPFLTITIKCGKSGSSLKNYTRRTIVNEPIKHFIKEVDFTGIDGLRAGQTAYTLDYDLLSSESPLDHIVLKSTESRADSGKKRKEENEIAKREFDHVPNLPVDRHFSTNSFSLLASLVVTEKTSQVRRPMLSRYTKGETNWVTITNPSGYITRHQDAVVAFAALQITWAHHAIKRSNYITTKKAPVNETPISLNAIAGLLEKSNNSDNYKVLRQSLDVNRKTRFSFSQDFDDKSNVAPTIHMFDKCNSVRNAKSSGKTEQEIFDESLTYVITWDKSIWESIIMQDSHHAIPEHLLKTDPTLVIFYLKLRSMEKLRIRKGLPKDRMYETDFEADRLFDNYLNMQPEEFLQLVYNQQKKDEKGNGSSYLIYSPEYPECFKLFGYTIDLTNIKNNSRNRDITISFSANSINEHLNLPTNNDGTPTIINEIPFYLREILENSPETASYRKQDYRSKTCGVYAEYYDKNEDSKSVVLSRYTPTDKLNINTTIFQTETHSRESLMVEFNSLIDQCHYLTSSDNEIVSADMLNNALAEITEQMVISFPLDIDVVVRYLSARPAAVDEIASLWNHQLEMHYETMQEIVGLHQDYR
ncbi:hypothetical protein [Vibrio agarivorans]|uniref:hypothetical protein n=1 Tax=Vibrio agarivorans TaxID=153622 RepID=UPI0025B60274|nr:hypothetical protein [Vibrio agarivorans]MDN3661175.1 hypothetical protein [Vibrio agarivorans]